MIGMTRRVALVGAAVLLAGCAASTSGTGSVSDPAVSPSHPPPTSAAGPTGFPSSSPTAVPSATTPSSIPARLTITGTSTGTVYTVAVSAMDTIKDCAAHAYGAALQAFLRRHPCLRATRRLVSLVQGARVVALSTVVVECPVGGASDPYRYAGQFADLERADGTGSMNDLLLDGVRVPGMGTRIPGAEVFTVLGQDNVVTVFDGWYESGTTARNDPAIRSVERDLFLTPVAVPAP